MTTTEENRDSLKDEKEALFKRRKNIVDEILSTEKTYETNLNTIVQSYMVPLRTDDKLSNLLTDDQFKTIFCDIEVILRYTTVFREQLTKRADTFDGNTTKLGDIFIMIADYLKVYTRYVNNYNEAQIVLRSLAEDNKNWVMWLYGRKEVNRLDLTDYLIMPVQRIPRYNLLLQDLVKNTPTEHCDYTDLCKARDRIQEIAIFVNEQKRVVENLAQVSEIIASITGLGVKFKLLSPTRRFIRQGELTQTNPEANKKEVFHFFLFNDLLIWCERKKKSSDKYQFHRLLYLSDMDIRLGFLDGKPGIGLALDDKKVVLLDKTEEGTDVWFNDLVSCRATILESENKGNIEKRKTFLHEELLQRAINTKEKETKKGTIKFKGLFRGSSGSDDKKDREKEKEKLEKEKESRDPRASKEKNMTINITKDLKTVHLNPLLSNGAGGITTPTKVDGPRIRAGTALPNRGSPTPMLPITNNTTPTRPAPIIKTEETTSTPPIKTSTSDESIPPAKPTNGPPLPKFNPARALSPPTVIIPKNKGPPPAVPTTPPPVNPGVTSPPENVNKPTPIRRQHSATINVNKAQIPGLVPKALKGQDPTPTPLAALNMPPKAASSPSLEPKVEKSTSGGSKSFLAGFASKFNLSNKEKEPVISGPNNVSKAALPPLIAATLAEQEKLREEEQRLRSASAADTSAPELPSPRGIHRRSLSTSH